MFVAAALAACGETSRVQITDSIGPNPRLPEPDREWIPSVNIAKAEPWPPGQAPRAAPGLKVQAFADGLDHPRWLHVLPNGDVLVAESNGPKKEPKGLRARVMQKVKAAAGAQTPSADRIALLRDADGDGVAETRSVFLQNVKSPFGMALVGDTLYVAHTDSLWRYPYRAGDQRVEGAGAKVIDLPSGRNHHWTKNVIASVDGKKLYVTVGSNSNVAENGMEEEEGRAAIWEVDVATGTHRIFAGGLRNPNGMDWNPSTGALWTVVNERDEIGPDLVPDYLTSVKDGAFYGWPYSYYGRHVDDRVKPPRPDMVDKAIPPDYALGPHVAALGLVFARGESSAARAALPKHYADGAFIGEHGSWNRKPRSGYEVVFVPFENGRPVGMPMVVLSGFLNGDGKAHGRPVGVALDRNGALLVADDVGNVVWRVTASEPPR